MSSSGKSNLKVCKITATDKHFNPKRIQGLWKYMEEKMEGVGEQGEDADLAV